MSNVRARASKSADEVVIEIPTGSTETLLQLRISYEGAAHLRRQIEHAEKDIARRMSLRGDHPLY